MNERTKVLLDFIIVESRDIRPSKRATGLLQSLRGLRYTMSR